MGMPFYRLSLSKTNRLDPQIRLQKGLYHLGRAGMEFRVCYYFPTVFTYRLSALQRLAIPYIIRSRKARRSSIYSLNLYACGYPRQLVII